MAPNPSVHLNRQLAETLERLIDHDPAVAKIDAVMMGAVDFGHHDLGGCSIAART